MKLDRLTLFSPLFTFAPFVTAWLAGPLLIRIPESNLLLETIVGQQFWFYTVTASWFGLVTCIMQGLLDPSRRKGVLGIASYVITLVALLAGFTLALQAIGTRIPRQLFWVLLFFMFTMAALIGAYWRKRTFLAVAMSLLTMALAATLSISIFAQVVDWPSWPSMVAALTFALPFTAKLSYQFGLFKTGNAAMVVLPIPLAWLVSTSLLAPQYIAVGVLYVSISVLLSMSESLAGDRGKVAGHWQLDQAVGKLTVTLLAILLAVRFLPSVS